MYPTHIMSSEENAMHLHHDILKHFFSSHRDSNLDPFDQKPAPYDLPKNTESGKWMSTCVVSSVSIFRSTKRYTVPPMYLYLRPLIHIIWNNFPLVLPTQPFQIWAQNWSDWPQMRQFQDCSGTFWLNGSLKKPGFVPFGANLTHFGSKSDISNVYSSFYPSQSRWHSVP